MVRDPKDHGILRNFQLLLCIIRVFVGLRGESVDHAGKVMVNVINLVHAISSRAILTCSDSLA
jgi:hypothetical protein